MQQKKKLCVEPKDSNIYSENILSCLIGSLVLMLSERRIT